MSSASHSAGSSGWLAQKTGAGPTFQWAGKVDAICRSRSNRAKRPRAGCILRSNTTCLHLHHIICYLHVSTNHVLTGTILHVSIFIISSAIYMSTPTMCSLAQYYMSSSSSYHLLSTCLPPPCAHWHNTTCLHLHHVICYLHVCTHQVLTDTILHVSIFIISSVIYMSAPTMCSLTQYYMSPSSSYHLLSTCLHPPCAH